MSGTGIECPFYIRDLFDLETVGLAGGISGWIRTLGGSSARRTMKVTYLTSKKSQKELCRILIYGMACHNGF